MAVAWVLLCFSFSGSLLSPPSFVTPGRTLSAGSVPVFPFFGHVPVLIVSSLVDSLCMSAPHYPEFISPSLFSSCSPGLLVERLPCLCSVLPIKYSRFVNFYVSLSPRSVFQRNGTTALFWTILSLILKMENEKTLS